jgi:hypothetical protein
VRCVDDRRRGPFFIINGGTCLDLNSGPGSAGDAYINQVLRIALHAPGSNCLDDPISPGAPQNIPLTTGTAQATVKNADDNTGASANSQPITGSVFNCATLARGDGGPVTLVGAFPSMNGLQIGATLLDSVTGFSLQCE